MLGEFFGQSLCIRQDRWQVLREVPHVPSQNYLALSVECLRDFHPVRDDRFFRVSTSLARAAGEPRRVFRRAPGLGQAAMARPDC